MISGEDLFQEENINYVSVLVLIFTAKFLLHLEYLSCIEENCFLWDKCLANRMKELKSRMSFCRNSKFNHLGFKK